ncbi:MAG: BMP family ABC transporter substrate-binding protein [Candidatus Heimdallarchaeota archaeon]|nr:BMP family ABC transporter substrate-binding protein [Candidatus Heimdallarchaeota archaeon]
MRKEQHYVIFTILLLSLLPFSGFSHQTNSPNQTELQILVVFAPSEQSTDRKPVFDRDAINTKFNDAIDNLEIAFSDQVNFTLKFPETLNEGHDILIENGNSSYDLLVGISNGFNYFGWGYDAAFVTIAGQNPEQSVLLIGGQIGILQGLSRSISYLEHEGSFLVGALAALVSKTGKLGFFGSDKSDQVEKYRYGFYQGANFVGDLIEVQFQFNDSTLDYSDPYDRTTEFIQNGFDVIYGVAGSSNHEIFQAVKDYNDTRTSEDSLVYAIGSDFDQDFLKPGLILTSMIKNYEIALTTEITNFINGDWVRGEEIYGVAGGHLGITEMIFTQAEKLREEDRFNGQTREELLLFLKKSISNGEIIVAPFDEDAEVNIDGENPFVEADKSLIVEADKSLIFEGNQFLVGSIVFALTAAIALFVLREQISRLIRKSDKSKAIDYLDKAKKIAEEPDE